jgi:hypothetical protein
MIISPDGKFRTSVEIDGDTTFIHHAEDTTMIAERAKFLRENTDRGFSPDRQYQCLGMIPLTDWYAAGLHKRPMEDTVKFLESEKMDAYRVTRGNTGKSGRIIVK